MTGGHQFDPHSDPVLARKGWLKCFYCGREVHGTERVPTRDDGDRCAGRPGTQRPTARRCEQCRRTSREAQSHVMYYRFTTPGQWLCLRCARRR